MRSAQIYDIDSGLLTNLTNRLAALAKKLRHERLHHGGLTELNSPQFVQTTLERSVVADIHEEDHIVRERVFKWRQQWQHDESHHRLFARHGCQQPGSLFEAETDRRELDPSLAIRPWNQQPCSTIRVMHDVPIPLNA